MSPNSKDKEERSKLTSLSTMTSQRSLLKQAEGKMISFGKPEGLKMSKKDKKESLLGLVEKGKAKQEGETSEPLLTVKSEEEGDLTKDLLKQEDILKDLLEAEEEDDEEGLADYATTEDIGLLHTLVETKLLEQQQVEERMQQALESKLQALMNLLPVAQEQMEHTGHSKALKGMDMGIAPVH